MADVKGDCRYGAAWAGESEINERVQKARLAGFQIARLSHGVGISREHGHPFERQFRTWDRCLSRACSISTILKAACSSGFQNSDDNGMLLLDLKDLRAMLQHVGDNAAQFKTQYAMSPPPASARSNGDCWSWKGRAVIGSRRACPRP